LPPRYDIALRVASEGTISTLDPCRARTWPERDLVAQLFEGLVARADRGFRPALASDWTVSADSLTWTFHMDARRTFGDGTPVRAADVVAS
jgi:ABC-type transport system substrate-binding protein